MVPFLRAARFFGLPVEVAVVASSMTLEGTSVSFRQRRIYLSSLVAQCALLLSCAGGLVAVLWLSGLTMGDVLALARSYGMSSTELAALFAAFVPNVVGTAWYARMYWHRDVAALNKFCRDFQNINIDVPKGTYLYVICVIFTLCLVSFNYLHNFHACSFPGSFEKIHRSLRMKLLFQYVLALASASLLTLARVLPISQSEQLGLRLDLFGPFVAMTFLISLVGTYPPIMAITYAMTIQTLESLCALLESYYALISGETPSDGKALDEQLSLGFQIDDLLCQVNGLLESPLIVDFVLSLYSLVFAVFFAILTVTAFSEDDVLALYLVNGVGCAVWSVFLGYRLFTLASSGQRLTTLMNKSGRRIQALQVDGHELIDRTLEVKSNILLDRYTVNGVISPMDIFCLGYSSILGAMTILMTDIFVLLQFKTGEANDGDVLSGNSSISATSTIFKGTALFIL